VRNQSEVSDHREEVRLQNIEVIFMEKKEKKGRNRI
jgi:hypothetical protein